MAEPGRADRATPRSVLYPPTEWDALSADLEVRRAEIEDASRALVERARACAASGGSADCALLLAESLSWLRQLPAHSVHAVVTDPPYGVLEYEAEDHGKLRRGSGGVWRIPPSFDGAQRSPVPRFTVLSSADRRRIADLFRDYGREFARVLVPGGHVFVASNPLVSTVTFGALEESGLEKRGEVIRLVQTLRGGDRPKGWEDVFEDITVMPRSCWEPWGLFRKPFEGTVGANLARWGAGALRRTSPSEPFRDVIPCSPTRPQERAIAPHPSLKPQRFLRQVVRASLPLGVGVVVDPFSGSGSTVAAAAALGYHAIGLERDEQYHAMACAAFEGLRTLEVRGERPDSR